MASKVDKNEEKKSKKTASKKPAVRKAAVNEESSTKKEVTRKNDDKKDGAKPSTGGKFQKGHVKVGGRKPGSKNKVTSDIRKLIIEQITPRIQKLGSDLDAMKPSDRAAALAQWANYVIPKYSNTTLNTDRTRDIGTEEMLKQLESTYQDADIQIDITKIKVHNNN